MICGRIVAYRCNLRWVIKVFCLATLGQRVPRAANESMKNMSNHCNGKYIREIPICQEAAMKRKEFATKSVALGRAREGT
jgi:hypothetical protein